MTLQARLDDRILRPAAGLLSARPFETVTLNAIAEVAETPISILRRKGISMHDVGTAILDHERASMRHAQKAARDRSEGPLELVVESFGTVGRLLAVDEVVRAGVRIASESRHCFPERRLNPFLTWQTFLTDTLRNAQRSGLLVANANIPQAVWLLVAAGMGAKDLLYLSGAWDEAESTMRNTAHSALETVKDRTVSSGAES